MRSEEYARPTHRIQNPQLHPNLLIGSLQLLVWIICYPSLWCRYVTSTDPALRPDFTLLDLRNGGWRSPLMRRILLGYAVYLPLTLLLSVLMLAVFGQTQDVVIVGMVDALVFTVFALILGGTWISVAVGLVLSFPGSLFCAVGYGAVGGLGYPTNLSLQAALIYGAVIGLAGGIGGSIADSIAGSRVDYRRVTWGSWISGAVSGVLLGAAASFSMHSLLRAIISLIFGSAPGGGSAQNLPLAIMLLLCLLLVFVASVGWERARLVLLINAMVLLVIVTLFAVFGQFQLLRGTTIGFTVMLVALIGLPYPVVARIAGPAVGAGATALGLGSGWLIWMISANGWSISAALPILLLIILGATLTWWSAIALHPIFEVWNLLVLRTDERRGPGAPALLHWHAAYWNENHRLPFHSLDEYLLMIAERNPVEGQAAIEELAGSRHQRWAAQAAQIELLARRLEQITTIEALASVAGNLSNSELAGPVSALLRGLARIGQTVSAALNSSTSYHKRLALGAAEESLDALLREMTLSNERTTARFRPVLVHWRQLIADHIQQLATAVEQTQEIDNPYIFSLPLSEQQDLFVGRADVAARIEQLIMDRRRPPVLLYGQRRMGKTSLLRNLGRLLPSNTVLLFVDGEGIAAASDYGDLLYALATTMARSADQHRQLSLPTPDRAALSANPFTAFNIWLDQVEATLERAQSVALLALDEFEALDSIRDRGRFDITDLLRVFRSLIQHRQRFKVLLAGSHTLEEFRHWASQLINLQVVKISYLAEPDALALIENPVRSFAVRYTSEASRRILALTRGHPHLVQLLCYEIIEIKNQQPPEQRFLVTMDDVEAAVPNALLTGDFFFADLSNQVGEDGLALLRRMVNQDGVTPVSMLLLEEQMREELERALTLLLRRDVIEPVEGGYRFQIELTRRWFARLDAPAAPLPLHARYEIRA